MEKAYKDLDIQFLPDTIIQDLNLQTLDSLVSQISNLSESFIICRNLTDNWY
jgi:hypothetical protein